MERSDEADRNLWAMFTMTLSCSLWRLSARPGPACGAPGVPARDRRSLQTVTAQPVRSARYPPL